MALPLAEILYHHTSQPPYLLPGRLVLLSISSLPPKCPSIICHGIFSPAALTPGLLSSCLLLSHILITSHFPVFTPYNSPLSLTLGINLGLLESVIHYVFFSSGHIRNLDRAQEDLKAASPIRHTTPLEACSAP